MDYNPRRTAGVVIALVAITIIAIVLLTNLNTIKRRLGLSPNSSVSSIQKEETAASLKYADEHGFVRLGDKTDAWKTDETFFDSEEASLAARMLERMKTLSIKTVGVEKTIRVQIVDYEGNLKADETFKVNLKGPDGFEKDYTDYDRDGFVVITDLVPGTYDVSLLPIEGYNVPDSPTKTSVLEFVEYVCVEDILLLVKQESTVKKETADKMELSAVDSQDSKLLNSIDFAPNAVYGIDISSNNGEVDWDKVYKTGIRCVMLRAGYRGAQNGELIEDELFIQNAKAAERAGLDVGAYFFSQAVTEMEAVEEASALLKLAEEVKTDYPLMIRLDRAGGTSRADEISKETRTQVMEAFCTTVKNAGYEPGVYSSLNWFKTNLDVKKASGYVVWLSSLKKDPPQVDYYYSMWQYSNKGKIAGVNGNVSLSLKYND